MVVEQRRPRRARRRKHLFKRLGEPPAVEPQRLVPDRFRHDSTKSRRRRLEDPEALEPRDDAVKSGGRACAEWHHARKPTRSRERRQITLCA